VKSDATAVSAELPHSGGTMHGCGLPPPRRGAAGGHEAAAVARPDGAREVAELAGVRARGAGAALRRPVGRRAVHVQEDAEPARDRALDGTVVRRPLVRRVGVRVIRIRRLARAREVAPRDRDLEDVGTQAAHLVERRVARVGTGRDHLRVVLDDGQLG
jgi:hypothetical protein